MIQFARAAAIVLSLAVLPAQFFFVEPAFAAADVAKLTTDANAGVAEAQYQLGNAYMKGDGVTADPAEATKWCRMAAEQDYIPAEVQLALKYLNGVGVAADPVEADKWMVIAATRDGKNQNLLRFVESRMKPDDIHHGHIAADQWIADHATPAKPAT